MCQTRSIQNCWNVFRTVWSAGQHKALPCSNLDTCTQHWVCSFKVGAISMCGSSCWLKWESMSNGDGRGRGENQIISAGWFRWFCLCCAPIYLLRPRPTPSIPGISSSILRTNTAKLGVPFVLLKNKVFSEQLLFSWLCNRRVAHDLGLFLFFQKEVKGIQQEISFSGRGFPQVAVAMFGLIKNQT